MRTLFVFFIASQLCSLNVVYAEFTENQMKTAAKLLRKNCQPKTKVSDETIENMHKGVWDDSPTAKCYAFCLLAFYKLVNKKGVFDIDSAAAQMDILPVPRRKDAWGAAQACNRECPECENKCDNAYAVLKCFYFFSPGNYFFP